MNINDITKLEDLNDDTTFGIHPLKLFTVNEQGDLENEKHFKDINSSVKSIESNVLSNIQK